MNQLEELEHKFYELQTAANKAKDELQQAKYKADQEALEPLKALTIKAHDTICRWNHTDGCSWGYEIVTDQPFSVHNNGHNWDGWAHRRWLEHIGEVVNPSKNSQHKPIDVETIDKLLDIVIEMKEAHPSALWILRYRLEP